MRCRSALTTLAALFVPAASVAAQPIIAQSSGLSSPGHVIDFGANLFPNFTPITTQFAGITVTHARYFTTGVSNNLVGGFLTNDPIGPPDTLRILFASPIADLSFVYHQIGTTQPSVFRAVLAGVTVASFSNLSNQTQPNNYFGFTNVVFDELQLDFVGDFNVDTLAYNDATGHATARPYGTGCVNRMASFYELFPAASAFDLSNTAMTMINTGSGYTMVPGITSFVAPSGAATSLNLTDDSEATVTLTGSFPFPGGTTGQLDVCSNGFVSVATGNGIGFTPGVPAMLAFAQTAWGGWHDYLPSGSGPSGQVMFEQIGTVAYVTWNGVNDFGNAVPNTWQLQFDTSSGFVHFVWQTMSLGGNSHLVFYSPGGASADPGNRDISATLPGSFSVGLGDVSALALTAATRPVSGTTCDLLTANIPAATPFGAVLLGFTQFNPGIDLTGVGMAGCFKYMDGAASFLFLGGGATHTTGIAIPTGYAGVHLFVQSAIFNPGAGLTALGAIASNGLDLGVDDL